VLLDGGNLMDISLTTGKSPVDITIEERRARDPEHQVLARFHADASDTPTVVTKEIRFYAHPKLLPPVQLTERDRDAIDKLVKSFYDALKRKDGKQVLALFAPGIDDARGIYPEGADFAQKQMNRMVSLLTIPGFQMQPFDSTGLEMSSQGGIVTVRRRDGSPVFESSEVTLPNGNRTSVHAETIPVKTIAGQWRLTLPFGF
jgi:hypothetical protein